MEVFAKVEEKAKEVNAKLDNMADEGIADAVKATRGFTFWALVGAALVALIVLGVAVAL